MSSSTSSRVINDVFLCQLYFYVGCPYLSYYEGLNHLLQGMNITDVPISIYPDNFPYGHSLSGSLNELSDVICMDNCVVCNGKYFNNNTFIEFYPSQHCADMFYHCGNGTEYHFQSI